MDFGVYPTFKWIKYLSFEDFVLDTRQLASKLGEFIIQEKLAEKIEECERINAFKLKLTLADLSEDMRTTIKNCTKVSVILKKTL